MSIRTNWLIERSEVLSEHDGEDMQPNFLWELTVKGHSVMESASWLFDVCVSSPSGVLQYAIIALDLAPGTW